jgi:hypothetical protein
LPQSHPTTPTAIYDTLLADATFMALVGTRTFEAGNTTLPALSVHTPGADLPKTSSISGLEVLIHDVVPQRRRNYLTGPADITFQWKVYLLAWPPANGSTMTAATTRVLELFSNAESIEVGPTPTGLGSIAQSLILISSDSAITAT